MGFKSLARRGGNSRLTSWLLVSFLLVLWVAGGASRPDVLGQAISQSFAWLCIIVFVSRSHRTDLRTVLPVFLILGLSIVLPILQLIPMPPFVWTNLPGRGLFVHAAEVVDRAQPWRPISVSPSATMNALGSLVVPTAVLLLVSDLRRKKDMMILSSLLALVLFGCFLALLQFSGAAYVNPFINYDTGVVAGNFANRNHFALFVAIGCLLTPVWGYHTKVVGGIRGLVPLAITPVLLMVILATGSRAGFALGLFGALTGFFIVRRKVRAALRDLPRSFSTTLVAGFSVLLIASVVLSVMYGRAYSLDRISDMEGAFGFRFQALPYVLEAIRLYWPVGAGFGTFDPVYRVIEPDRLLEARYLNHAHNDVLEILLDGGVVAAAIFVGALIWWLRASVRVWRAQDGDATMAQVGSLVIFMVLLASLVDYPARTPIVMAILTLAGVWLSRGVQFPRKHREHR